MDKDLKKLIENTVNKVFSNGIPISGEEKYLKQQPGGTMMAVNCDETKNAKASYRVYNKSLCPELWDQSKHLNEEVRVNLLKLAHDFYEKTEFKSPIIDIYLMGSSANYNWTPDSDADVHILIDFNQLQMPIETAKNSIKLAGSQWNLEHNITVKGHKVELNIQSVSDEKPHVTGIYSLIKNQWVREPSRLDVNIDKAAIQVKYKAMYQYVTSIIQSGSREKMKGAKTYLDTFRQYGLDNQGELSVENIVYKILRARGVIKRLKDAIVSTYDQQMTVKEKIREGYGAGIPEEDRLHIKGSRWQIRSKDAPKTPKMSMEEFNNKVINETLKQLFESPKLLQETMDVMVKGFNYERELNRLDELTNYLIDKVLLPIVKALPPDQLNYFNKNKIGPVYDMLTPDGSYWSGPSKGTGVINFYISGFARNNIKEILNDVVKQILRGVVNECNKLKVKVGKFTLENSGVYKSQVIRIPIVKNNVSPTQGPPKLNMANDNMIHILKNILQIDSDDDSGSLFNIKTDELIDSILSLEGDKTWIGQNIRKPTDTKLDVKEPPFPGDEWKQETEPEEELSDTDHPNDAISKRLGGGGARMIGMGFDADAIRKNLNKIMEIAMWAKKHGYPEIYVA